MTLLNDHVAEEDLKLFRHVKEITAKVWRVNHPLSTEEKV